MVASVLSMFATLSTSTTSEARCYSIWRYPKPQHCGLVDRTRHFSALVALAYAKPALRIPETFHEQIIEVPIPPLDFDACPEGDERMRGIALLREKLE